MNWPWLFRAWSPGLAGVFSGATELQPMPRMDTDKEKRPRMGGRAIVTYGAGLASGLSAIGAMMVNYCRVRIRK